MVHVLLETPSPRARYIIRHVFERMLGWPVIFVASRDELSHAEGPKLSYTGDPTTGAVHIPASGWLSKTDIPEEAPLDARMVGDRLPGLGEVDLFSALFFFLSLVQEHTITDRDEHDRVPAASLWAVRHGMEHRPFVDEWVLGLAEVLRQRWPTLPAPERDFTHVLTVDMDNGLKYRGRPMHRALGASAKELLRGDLRGLGQRWRARFGAGDPYLLSVKNLQAIANDVDRMIAFTLVKGNGRFDHAADLGHPAYRSLLADLSLIAEIGLHPSYNSSLDPALFETERERLMATTGRLCTVTRQHFLRWRLPGTLRQLIADGFTEEHSLGFPDRAGFRAGTCTPFKWYDLERDEETPLLIVPFTVMDSALRERQGKALDEALKMMMAACDSVRRVGGTFVSVWHDRYLSGHRPFTDGPDAMRRLVQHAGT